MNFANLGAALRDAATAAAAQFVRFDTESMKLSVSPHVVVGFARKRRLDITVARDNIGVERRIAFGFTVDARVSTFTGTRTSAGLSVVAHPVAGTILFRHRYKVIELAANALLAVIGWKRRFTHAGFRFDVTGLDSGWAAIVALLPHRNDPCLRGAVCDSWLEVRFIDVEPGELLRAAPEAVAKLIAYALPLRP